MRIGDRFNGYIRMVKLHQDWKLDVTEIGNSVTTSGCIEYPDSSGNTCSVCSPQIINTHDINTCFVKCDENSYGPDCSDTCHWKCNRCSGPTENDCHECRPYLNLQIILNPETPGED